MAEAQDAKLNRRTFVSASTGALVGAAMVTHGAATAAGEPVVKKGQIRQSVVQWCFAEHWTVEETIVIAKRLGCKSVELIAPEHFSTLKKHEMECAIGTIDMGDGPPFTRGFNNPKHFDELKKATLKSIDECSRFGCKRVIAFTGMADGISREEGADNCVAQFKKVVGYAEKKGVTLCLEMLNTRDDTHPMKGHPGYQGDDTEYCVDIIQRVGSENLKLLFDIYHVQIMNGDVIRRIHQHKDHIGHIHTAGNPGRGELNESQELQYPPIMKALLEIGYQGFVGQEFIPVGDPLAGLKQAVALCDV
ncbi:MAG: TIM barrel protein [Pirellulaceae bacterium]|nr:hydroxypyruvate isomerase [Planctomycetaceae bacterium]